ncbi:hypothetical protein DNH61_19145 [Paenibacillus sambharensis]|uniref:Uncharacterized protein n=1 Tax=Paenibacillus sambharensis TaxID=1803190 RepID=A0A2W1LRK3_9BACL|nr:phytoene/squalene synthase family protein [Paenibacillus sambharensis]PZD94077.1 hypothetical protein DNH61_19145 [Paenibacillus sambharensis]
MNKKIVTELQACEAMIKRGSTTFYKAFGFLPSPRREAVYVIYAFCRMIDDAVDEPEKAVYTLDELSAKFERLEEAGGHFIWPALRWLMAEFPVSREPFLRQMRGQRLDGHRLHYKTVEELEEYAYLVAGTVGEMLIPVLHDRPGEEMRESGVWLGKAMQIVNIIRDVGEDKAKGRRYVPLEVMERHGYTPEMFDSGLINDAWISTIQELSGMARQWFAKGLRDLDGYPKVSGFCVELSALMYEAILDSVEAGGYDVFRSRAYVSSGRKLVIVQRLMKRHAVMPQDADKRTPGTSAVS